MTPKIRKPFAGEFPMTLKFGDAPEWYLKRAGYPHNGLDFAMPEGTPILACDDGKITYADNIPDSDGIGINIGHDWGLSQYWHLRLLSATLGQVVKRGEMIGHSGRTGWATGPHLHFGTKRPEDSLPEMRGWANPITYMAETPAEPEPPLIIPQTYFVRPGDSLWKIATRFYENGIYWKKIYEANKKKIQDPNKIYPFQRLLIP
ncbi:MAG TPA: peptidoglycan DD-metalloendopeptidase family protein [Patescibacteria group bacterium]|nr:peptidoglycan DD-metalloendopeptidase family protein [Patescibacteria group bacterium]